MSRQQPTAHYIYVPGFGGGADWLRELALWTWRLRGISASMVEMRWKDKTESLETKRDRLYAELQKHAKADVTLIGESAGGAMVVYAMYLYPNLVHRLITVAGYNRGNESLNPKYSRAHPTFSRLSQLAESANQAFTSSQRSKITTIVSPLDRVVPERYSYIKDARVIRLSTNGHMGTIRYILTHTLKNIL